MLFFHECCEIRDADGLSFTGGPLGAPAAPGQSWWWDGLRPEWSRTRTRTRTRSWFSAELQTVDQNVSALIQHEVWVLFWSFDGFIFFPAVDQCEAAAVTKTTGLRSVSLTVTSPNITEPKWVYSFIESLMETWSGQKRWQASFLWESEVQRTVTLWHHRVTLKSISSLIKEGYIINLCSFELKFWALSSLTGEKKNTDINSIFIYLSSSAVTTRHLIKLFSYWSLLLAIVCQMMSKCDI